MFYENEANLAKLWNVIAVYAWVDNDIGYVQGRQLYYICPISPKNVLLQISLLFSTGMSDICSPMVILLENEADAFWCFERSMRRLVGAVLIEAFLSLNCFICCPVFA